MKLLGLVLLISKIQEILGSKVVYAHGICCPRFGTAYARLARSTHPDRTSEKVGFNSPTPLFVHADLSIKQTRGDFVLILINLRFGIKFMV